MSEIKSNQIVGTAGLARITAGPDVRVKESNIFIPENQNLPSYLTAHLGLANSFSQLATLRQMSGHIQEAEDLVKHSIELYERLTYELRREAERIELRDKKQSKESDSSSIRTEFIYRVVGRKTILQCLEHYEVVSNPQDYDLVLVEILPATASDYAEFLQAFSSIYHSFVSLGKASYIDDIWINRCNTILESQDDMYIRTIKKQSPEHLTISALNTAIKALADTLSIGKQYAEIRKASINVKKAKIEAERMELELQELRRADHIAENSSKIDTTVSIERKKAELMELNKKALERELQARDMIRQDFRETLKLIKEVYTAIDVLPTDLQEQLIKQLEDNVFTIQSGPFELAQFNKAGDSTIG